MIDSAILKLLDTTDEKDVSVGPHIQAKIGNITQWAILYHVASTDTNYIISDMGEILTKFSNVPDKDSPSFAKLPNH